MIAALYVDPRGPYCAGPLAELCDAWPAERNASLYAGPLPVVAHPPCGPWGKLRQMALVGRQSDAACMPHAVAAVRRCGGVLEQPAGSKAFEQFGMPLPGEPPDAWGGYTIEVDQVEWGHVARKRTWLYLVGVPQSALEAPPFPGRQPTHWCSGSRNAPRGPVPPGIKVCSRQQRNRTPPMFAAYLIRLAESVR